MNTQHVLHNYIFIVCMKNTEAVIMEYRIERCEWTGGRQNKRKKKDKTRKGKF